MGPFREETGTNEMAKNGKLPYCIKIWTDGIFE